MSTQYQGWSSEEAAPLAQPRGVKSKALLPFAESSKDGTPETELERCGHATLELVAKAAEVARSDLQRAEEESDKLADQLRAAQERNAQLEVHLRHFQDRAARAEKWLARIYAEIENEFFKKGAAAHPDRIDR
jgi:septal ring factor EnvC (AmiA/AmiB activator)